jgi:peptide/nickel transport system permease protein
VNGYGSSFAGHLDHLFLPALTIALAFSTILVRTLRSSTLAVLSADYIDTAKIKGISRFRILRRHVFRNAVVSVVVVFGINLAYLISTTVIIENVFSIPGLGSLLVDSVSTRDYPVVQGVTIVFAVMVVGINLLTDVVHAALDPRVVLE